jgi:hypothetical protein
MSSRGKPKLAVPSDVLERHPTKGLFFASPWLLGRFRRGDGSGGVESWSLVAEGFTRQSRGCTFIVSLSLLSPRTGSRLGSARRVMLSIDGRGPDVAVVVGARRMFGF